MPRFEFCLPTLGKSVPVPEAPNEAWRVFYDVPVGTISIRAGVPVDAKSMGLEVRLLSRARAGPARDGSARSYEEAREAFQFAWRHALLAKRPCRGQSYPAAGERLPIPPTRWTLIRRDKNHAKICI